MLIKPAQGASWEVKSRSTTCHDSGREFEEGESLVSRLVRTPEGLERQDFSLGAWNGERKADALFYWRTTFRLPPPKKEEPFKEENAEEFLRELLERNDPSLVNTLFILAAMLERKRLLIERGVQQDPDGRRVRIYEHKDSGETFFIVDPQLSLEQIGDVQIEVAQTLGWMPVEEEGDKEEEGEGNKDGQDGQDFGSTAGEEGDQEEEEGNRDRQDGQDSGSTAGEEGRNKDEERDKEEEGERNKDG